MAASKQLVQYIVLRKDLAKPPLRWSAGSVVTQACHASVAAVAAHFDDEGVREYALGQMRKVVLAARDEDELAAVAQRLERAGVPHSVWTEEPEGVRTALATRPGRAEELRPLFSDLKLYR